MTRSRRHWWGLITRAAVGAAIGAVLMHHASEVLWHESRSWFDLATVLTSIGGAFVAAIGRRAWPIAMPVAALWAASLACIAVFDYHAEEGLDLEVELGFKVDEPRKATTPPISPYLLSIAKTDVEVDVYPSAPEPKGCGSVGLYIDYTARHRDFRAFREALSVQLTITYPYSDRSQVSATKGKIISRGSAPVEGLTATIENAADEQLLQSRVLFVSFSVRIEGLAQPRGVGSCYVPIPAVTGTTLTYVPGTDETSIEFEPPDRGIVELSADDSILVQDDTHPALARLLRKIGHNGTATRHVQTRSGSSTMNAPWT